MPYHADCTLMGHITADPELKPGEKPYAKFSLAVDTRAKINGEWGKRTTFWRCTVWGKDAEWLARDAHKGSLVLITGEPYSEDYEKDGQKKTRPHHVSCRTARCLERKADGVKSREQAEAQPAAPKRPAAAPVGGGYGDSEPPFAKSFGEW